MCIPKTQDENLNRIIEASLKITEFLGNFNNEGRWFSDERIHIRNYELFGFLEILYTNETSSESVFLIDNLVLVRYHKGEWEDYILNKLLSYFNEDDTH